METPSEGRGEGDVDDPVAAGLYGIEAGRENMLDAPSAKGMDNVLMSEFEGSPSSDRPNLASGMGALVGLPMLGTPPFTAGEGSDAVLASC